MPKLTIDGKEIEVEEGLTLMQACEQAGTEIPHFCFHERLNIAGNCRMCLVEVEKAPKPVASCAMNVAEGMVVRTNTKTVKKAREGVMEFLLINHPLDCPICDQGGECDLQDQAFKYGRGGSRYSENKRAVKDKNLGPLVKTHMTRCIHCTRCVRFSTEIAGVPEMGAIGRGEHMEITSYLEKTLTSELSGNVIDLCPVGALTSKPYAFRARSWELEKTESIDVMDALGSNIRVDSVGLEVMRILPKINEEVNEEWLSDKARFAYDGLKNQRLDRPYIKNNGKIEECGWDEAISAVMQKLSSLKNSEIAAIAGTDVSVEPLFLLKKLLEKLGSNLYDANQHGYKIDTSSRANYLFNSTIYGLEEADLCLLIGANPRQVAPVLGARIGRLVRNNKMAVYRIGEADDQTYPVRELGDSLAIIEDIISDKHEFSKKLAEAKKPIVIVGDSIMLRKDGFAALSKIHDLVDKFAIVKPDWNGFNVLHNHAAMVGALDIGFVCGNEGNGAEEILKKTQDGTVKVLYLFNADEIDPNEIAKDTFVIYHGHHGDKLVNRADVILPSAAYTEQDGIYVNTEGRPQYARMAVSAPGKAKRDWEIISRIAGELEIEPWPTSFAEVRNNLAKEHPIFAHIDEIIPSKFIRLRAAVKLAKDPLVKNKFNFYMTDQISRASATMAKCTKAILQQQEVEGVS